MAQETRSAITGLLASLLIVAAVSTTARLWKNAADAHNALLQAQELNARLDVARR